MNARDSQATGAPGLRVVQAPPGRLPPYSLDAERCVLGGILLDPEALSEVQTILRPQDFYREVHRKIFEAMVAGAAKGEPVDRVTVKDELVKMGALEDVGGEDFIDLLDKLVPSGANLAHYATIVRDKALARGAIEAAHAVATMGYEQAGEVAELLDFAEQKFYALRSQRIEHALVKVRDLLTPVFKDVEQRGESTGIVTGLASGLDELDGITGGFQDGDMVVVAGRTSMGKTALALQVVVNCCRTRKAAAGVFSLEMPKKSLVERMLSNEARVNSTHVRSGQLSGPEWERLTLAASRMAEMELHINDSARTALEIRALSRRLASRLAGTEAPLRLVVIDYLQLIEGDGGEQNREREVAQATRGLKQLAKDLNLPVLALSQLSRKLEERPDKRPRLSDLRESGSIEQDSDLVIFIYRDEAYRKETVDKGVAELIVGKQRNGPVGTARVAFRKEFTAFEDLPGGGAPSQLGFDEPPPPTEEWGNGAKA